MVRIGGSTPEGEHIKVNPEKQIIWEGTKSFVLVLQTETSANKS